MIRKILFVILFFTFVQWSYACECPLSELSLEETNKYEIIFKGKIVSVKNCADKYGEAMFEVQELYKGNATGEFKVLFECDVECAQKLNVGDEWIIYSRYKQIDNALLDWCSRSRRYIMNEKEDFYSVTYGNDYFTEVEFLRTKLGLHRLLTGNQNQVENRNTIPNQNQVLITILISIAGIVLFYWLFNRFFK